MQWLPTDRDELVKRLCQKTKVARCHKKGTQTQKKGRVRLYEPLKKKFGRDIDPMQLTIKRDRAICLWTKQQIQDVLRLTESKERTMEPWLQYHEVTSKECVQWKYLKE